MDLRKVKIYLEANARPVDIALFNYHFEAGTAENVINELEKFQNEDGGFGNAIEPDLRLPQSTALATWMAFQIIKQLKVDSDHVVIQRALEYLANTFSDQKIGWTIIRPEVDDYPHAPWWDYKTAMEHFSWANPNAELLGIFMIYGAKFQNLIETLQKKAIDQISHVDSSDFHDVFNYKALYGMGDDELKKLLKEPLSHLIKEAVTTDASKWKDYVAPPLRFINSPEDSFINLFDQELIQKNIKFLQSQMVYGDHWEPNWNWDGNYPEEWELAKREWSGHLTVNNVLLLKKFGQIN